MTHDAVDEVIQAYLDHLEEGVPEPSLDHLNPEERELAKGLINSLNAGRGLNPYQSRPSFSTLIADTEFESMVAPPVHAGLTINAIRADVVSALGAEAEMIVDGAAAAEGIRSDVVIVCRGVRLCVQLRDDITTASALAQVDPRAAAGPIYGRFSGRTGVILVTSNTELLSVPISPYDIDEYVGAPDGQLHPPRIMRPILPLVDTLRSYIEEVAPDLSIAATEVAADTIDASGIIAIAVAEACSAVVTEGKKSRTESKKQTWATFENSTALVTAITTEIWNRELSPEDLRERLDTAAPAA